MMILSGPSNPKFICEALVVSVSAGDVGRVLVVEVADIGLNPLPPSLEMLMERSERGPGMFEAYMQRCVLDVSWKGGYMKLRVVDEDDAKFGNVDGFSHRVQVRASHLPRGNELYLL